MKRIFSIIMELGLGLPTGTIAFWGTLVPRILTVNTFKYAWSRDGNIKVMLPPGNVHALSTMADLSSLVSECAVKKVR